MVFKTPAFLIKIKNLNGKSGIEYIMVNKTAVTTKPAGIEDLHKQNKNPAAEKTMSKTAFNSFFNRPVIVTFSANENRLNIQ